jgi:CCR4-NOT transcription complex subunit 3
MADRRKLQAEIDRTMKKIDEGIEVYDRIFQKVEGAETKEHKEKYEVRARF